MYLCILSLQITIYKDAISQDQLNFSKYFYGFEQKCKNSENVYNFLGSSGLNAYTQDPTKKREEPLELF